MGFTTVGTISIQVAGSEKGLSDGISAKPLRISQAHLLAKSVAVVLNKGVSASRDLGPASFVGRGVTWHLQVFGTQPFFGGCTHLLLNVGLPPSPPKGLGGS